LLAGPFDLSGPRREAPEEYRGLIPYLILTDINETGEIRMVTAGGDLMLVHGKSRRGSLYIHMSSGFHKIGDYREEYSVAPGDRLMSRLTKRIYTIVSVHLGVKAYADLDLEEVIRNS
jgi:hypothetical protein